MGGDPWDVPSDPRPKPSGGMRCDPKQPLPRLDPKEWAAIAADLVTAAKHALSPLARLLELGAAPWRGMTEEEVRARTEEIVRQREREGRLPQHPGMGSPKPIDDRFQAREKLEFLKAQRYQAGQAGDSERYRQLSEQIAWLEYNLANQPGGGYTTANQGDGGQGGATGGQGGSSGGQGGSTGGQSGGGQVSSEGNDRPRTDGMQGETQGGAPLAPPPGNQAPPPTHGRGPIPQPDLPRRPHPGGPFRTPGR